MWKHAIGVAAAFAFFLAAPGPSDAQQKYYGFLPPLTKQDIALIREKTDDFERSAAGASESWSNPDSGNSGVVTLMQKFVRQGYPCQQISYVLNMNGESSPRQYTVVWCKTEDGEWKIL
ncbi:MAG: hypothetical protein GY791_13055 [Alphaproteobacteria bacterium]|nr:hypothetical protein [Alphaproteobacteria bacterium]